MKHNKPHYRPTQSKNDFQTEAEVGPTQEGLIVDHSEPDKGAEAPPATDEPASNPAPVALGSIRADHIRNGMTLLCKGELLRVSRVVHGERGIVNVYLDRGNGYEIHWPLFTHSVVEVEQKS